MTQGLTRLIDRDPFLTKDSDLIVPSQKAVKAYIDRHHPGLGLVVSEYLAVGWGRYNENIWISETVWDDSGPIFLVGNGLDADNRSNSFVLWKDGAASFGSSNKYERLTIEGRVSMLSLDVDPFDSIANYGSYYIKGGRPFFFYDEAEELLTEGSTTIIDIETNIDNLLAWQVLVNNWMIEAEDRIGSGGASGNTDFVLLPVGNDQGIVTVSNIAITPRSPMGEINQFQFSVAGKPMIWFGAKADGTGNIYDEIAGVSGDFLVTGDLSVDGESLLEGWVRCATGIKVNEDLELTHVGTVSFITSGGTLNLSAITGAYINIGVNEGIFRVVSGGKLVQNYDPTTHALSLYHNDIAVAGTRAEGFDVLAGEYYVTGNKLLFHYSEGFETDNDISGATMKLIESHLSSNYDYTFDNTGDLGVGIYDSKVASLVNFRKLYSTSEYLTIAYSEQTGTINFGLNMGLYNPLPDTTGKEDYFLRVNADEDAVWVLFDIWEWLPDDTDHDGKVLSTDGAGTLSWIARESGAETGEINTGYNLGAGVGIYKGKTDARLDFYSLLSLHSALDISLNSTDNVIEFDIDPDVLFPSATNNNGKALMLADGSRAWLDPLSGFDIYDHLPDDYAEKAGYVLTVSALGVLSWTAKDSEGEANRGANVGDAGTGVYKGMNGVNLEFYKLNSLSAALAIVLDSETNQINFSVNTEGSLPSQSGHATKFLQTNGTSLSWALAVTSGSSVGEGNAVYSGLNGSVAEFRSLSSANAYLTIAPSQDSKELIFTIDLSTYDPLAGFDINTYLFDGIWDWDGSSFNPFDEKAEACFYTATANLPDGTANLLLDRNFYATNLYSSGSVYIRVGTAWSVLATQAYVDNAIAGLSSEDHRLTAVTGSGNSTVTFTVKDPTQTSQIDLSLNLAHTHGIIPVTQGGTGLATLTSGSYLKGAGANVTLIAATGVCADIGALKSNADNTYDYTFSFNSYRYLKFGTTEASPRLGGPGTHLFVQLMSTTGQVQFLNTNGTIMGKFQDDGLGGWFEAYHRGISRMKTSSTGITVTGVMNASGDVESWVNLSDRCLKKDDIEILNGLATIEQLRPVYFSWINTNEPDVGFIAQEAGNVIPQASWLRTDGYYGLRTERIVPFAIAAIKELKQYIAGLELKIRRLENELPSSS